MTCSQVGIWLDKLYDLVVADLRAAELESELERLLERLCQGVRAQDQALPLALLAVWSYGAAGGHQEERALPVAAAWRCLHTAGKLLNDAAGRGFSSLLPDEPVQGLLNAGVSFIFLSQAILSQATTGAVARELQAAFARAGLRAAAGQQARLERGGTLSWESYQAITAMRSGCPLALATRAGALVRWGERLDSDDSRGTMPGYVEALADYGYHLGMMLQLADDWKGTWHPDAKSDLAMGKRAWPLLYGESLGNAEQRARLLALAPRAMEDPLAERALQELLVELDVPLVMVLSAEEHRHRAETALEPLADSPARYALVMLARRVSLAPEGVRT